MNLFRKLVILSHRYPGMAISLLVVMWFASGILMIYSGGMPEVHRLNRVERWLYSGLHDLDFSFWYVRRPLWDIGVITLCLGGLASSSIGLFLGIKRLLRLG